MTWLRLGTRSRWHALLVLAILTWRVGDRLRRASNQMQLALVRAALRNPTMAATTRDQLARASEHYELPEDWAAALEEER